MHTKAKTNTESLNCCMNNKGKDHTAHLHNLISTSVIPFWIEILASLTVLCVTLSEGPFFRVTTLISRHNYLVRTWKVENLQALVGIMMDYLKQYQHAKAFRKNMPILHIGTIVQIDMHSFFIEDTFNWSAQY